jgi:uncharacterized small protein (TIGR04563 family)
MAATDKQKQSLYFPDEMLREIVTEANRLDRSLSWIVQHAWRQAREGVRKFPSAEPRGGAEPERPPADARSASADRRQPSTQVREFLRGQFDSELTS